ncbi:hypothetical protein JCM15640A_11160 [Hoylesella timonensis 4401737 = DSM 22865 = JCM 15640]|uniref:hypothetical protein n=1 Tax=Hoylesella timonensis TaxID=386414 RepID=UPI000413E106|nr:hypothetical protein [Hoylesella timonensis]
MKKIYQQPLINIIKINADDLLKTVVASLEDDAAGAKQFDFNDSFEDNDGLVWSADDYKQEP